MAESLSERMAAAAKRNKDAIKSKRGIAPEKNTKSTLTTRTKVKKQEGSFVARQKEKLRQERESRNRISHILNDLIGTEHPDDLMTKIIGSLSASGRVPQEGKYYVFIYNAKTPNLRYDQHPMVAVTDVFEWGFRGINFHWNTHRNYTWNEIVDGLYEITHSELTDLDGVPFARFRMNV